MSILINLISLIESNSSLSGFELDDIQSLVSRIHISDSSKLIHYTMLTKAVLELTGPKANLYDLELNDTQSLTEIPNYIFRLAFRVGKAFKDSRIECKINSILTNFYDKHVLDGFTFYTHKDTNLDIKVLNDMIINMRTYGKYQQLDKMLINSIFGEVFYWRDR